MSALSFEMLRRVNVDRCVNGWKHDLAHWSLADWIVAAGGELGEALNLIKKLARERDGLIGNSKDVPQLRSDLADELADAMIYLDLLCAATNTYPFAGERFAKDFDGLRIGTVQHFSAVSAGLEKHGARALARFGRLALFWEDGGFRDRGWEEIRRFESMVRYAVESIDGIAWSADIDLGSAVVAKFNQTSEKHGFTHKLEVA